MAIIAPDLQRIFEPDVVAALRDQLSRAIGRLSARTSHRPPSLAVLLPALYFDIRRSDETRAEEAKEIHHPPNYHLPVEDAPSRDDLLRYLSIAEATYTQYESELENRLRNVGLSAPLIDHSFGVSGRINLQDRVHRVASDMFEPAYVLSVDTENDTLILAIRGSFETADFITDGAGDTIEFLDGFHAHEGVARSAKYLHATLRSKMAATLDGIAVRRVVVLGHSLGAGCAAALTLLLRRPRTDGESETDHARDMLSKTTCYAFAPPPIFEERLAKKTADMRQGNQPVIVTVVSGYDLVPRLSVRALDKLLVRLAHFDFSKSVEVNATSTISAVAQPIFGTDVGSRIAQSLGPFAQTLGESALAAIAQADTQTVLGSAARALSSTVLNEVRDHTQRTSMREFSEAMSQLTVGDDQPLLLRLPGKVWYLERKFQSPVGLGDEPVVPKAKLVSKPADWFDTIELSGWNIHDHMVLNMLSVVRTLPNAMPVRSNSQQTGSVSVTSSTRQSSQVQTPPAGLRSSSSTALGQLSPACILPHRNPRGMEASIPRRNGMASARAPILLTRAVRDVGQGNVTAREDSWRMVRLSPSPSPSPSLSPSPSPSRSGLSPARSESLSWSPPRQRSGRCVRALSDEHEGRSIYEE